MAKSYTWETAEEINQNVAGRMRNLRRRRGISQRKLSCISGVSLGSIKRFEESGEISLKSLTKIAIALDSVEEIRQLFTKAVYLNIEEVARQLPTT